MHEKSLANYLRHPSDRASKSSFASTIQMLRLAIATGVSLAAWSIASPSFAIRLIGNTPQGTSFDATTMNGTNQKGVSFTLPSGTNYTLNNLTLTLRNYISATDTPLVQIRDNTGLDGTGNPIPSGTALVNFTKPTSTSDAVGNFTFTPTASFTFQASTTYWLFVDNLNTGTATQFIWTRSNPSVAPNTGGIATFNSYRYSTNNGTSYDVNNPNYNTFNLDVVPFEFSPALGLGLLGVWVAGSKLRNKFKQQVKL